MYVSYLSSRWSEKYMGARRRMPLNPKEVRPLETAFALARIEGSSEFQDAAMEEIKKEIEARKGNNFSPDVYIVQGLEIALNLLINTPPKNK